MAHKFRAGAFIIPNADRAAIEPSIRDLGLSALGRLASQPNGENASDWTFPESVIYTPGSERRMKAGYAPRWIIMACRTPISPIKKLREGNLRAKYDVIVYPHVGGTSQSHINGIPKNGPDPVPYKKSKLTPNLGALDPERRYPRRHGHGWVS